MLASKNNWKDVQKYYHNTFVKFSSEGEKIWHITKVSDILILAKDRTGEEVGIELARPFNIDYVLPKKAVYQYGDHAAILQRLPQRMWKKGLSNENTSLSICSPAGGWTPIDFSIETLEGFVNKPSYYSFADAKNLFENGESLMSAALSPRVSLTRKGGVFIDTVLVGKLNKGGLLAKSTFLSDLAPLFPNVFTKAL